MGRHTITIVTLALGLLLSLDNPLLTEAQESKQPLRVRGATTVASMIQPWMREFEEKNPGVRVAVYGSTHGEGLKALLSGTAEVAMTARELSDKERQEAEQKGLKIVEEKICNDAVAIIVNQENSVKELSLDQLRNVFSGTYTNWSQLGGANEPIVVVALPPDSGMASFLSKDVFKVPFATSAIVERIPRAVLPLVRSRKGAISFCRTDLALKEVATGHIKTLAIKKDDSSPAVVLSKETVANGTFPIMRPLGLCYDSAKAAPGAKKLGEFCKAKWTLSDNL